MKKLLIILLCLPLGACYDTFDRLDQFNTDLLPKVRFEPSASVRANGVDTVTLKLLFPLASDRDKIKAMFTTKVSSFVENGEMKYTASRVTVEDIDGLHYVLTARMVSTTSPGEFELLFEATEINWWASSNLTFRRAHPASISTSASKFSVAIGFTDEIQLSANLKSGSGIASKGTEVEYIVADSLSSASSNRFRALTKSNASGVSSVFFTPGTFGGYTGPVSYEVVTIDEDGAELRTSGTFQVIDPS
ncbi:hypothetical protein [Ekhidna sp.]|uniref:hypothetical protein n=1 Tax=Ekhidna sp. TaxID=2608089 RepID=UPI003299735E